MSILRSVPNAIQLWAIAQPAVASDNAQAVNQARCCDDSIRRVSVERPKFISRRRDARRYRQNLQAACYGLHPVLNSNGKFDPAEILQTHSLPESNARKNVPRL